MLTLNFHQHSVSINYAMWVIGKEKLFEAGGVPPSTDNCAWYSGCEGVGGLCALQALPKNRDTIS